MDVRDIKPGQYFNRDFEAVIRDQSIRFLAVVSKDYISKAKISDTGVMNEILCARTIKDVQDFIIPLKYDETDYAQFGSGLIGRQAINFSINWADGLHELVKYLEEINAPKTNHETSIIGLWHQAQKVKTKPIEKREKYFTNWFPCYLPEKIYIHQDLSLKYNATKSPFAFIEEGNRIISFTNLSTFGENHELQPIELSTVSFIASSPLYVEDGYIIIEPQKKLIKLMNKLLRLYLCSHGLFKYVQANKKEIYYFPYNNYNAKSVNLKVFGKSRRAIVGKTSEFTWHFAISYAAAIEPTPCYKVYYHLVFTDHEGNQLNPEDQHELRRSMPSGWFNRKWLETLLAMMYKISNFNNEKEINIEVGPKKFLSIETLPLEIISEIGYNEPKSEFAD